METVGLDFIGTLRLTFRNPRHAARVVMSWPFSQGERWAILALAAVSSTLLAKLVATLSPDAVDLKLLVFLEDPVFFAAVQLAGLAAIAGLIYGVGRQFGGVGKFAEVLSILGWIQFVLLALQVAQIVAMALLPPMAVVIGLGSLVLTLWLLPNFIAELHGFRSAVVTFLGMIGTMVSVVVILSILLIVVLGVGG
jgi:Yip1 domain